MQAREVPVDNSIRLTLPTPAMRLPDQVGWICQW
jgi:hypothetical protein